jgi:ABC-type spermidine/putrescine transport system permease subunit II
MRADCRNEADQRLRCTAGDRFSTLEVYRAAAVSLFVVDAFLRYVLIASAAAICGAIGIATLGHPLMGWDYGFAHKSASSPLLGVGLLVVPPTVAGIGLYRFYESIMLRRLTRPLGRGTSSRRLANRA